MNEISKDMFYYLARPRETLIVAIDTAMVQENWVWVMTGFEHDKIKVEIRRSK